MSKFSSLIKLSAGIYAFKKVLEKIPLCSVCKIKMIPDLNFRCLKCNRFEQTGFWNKKDND